MNNTMKRKKDYLSKINTVYRREKNSIEARNSVNCAGRCVRITRINLGTGKEGVRQYVGDKITAEAVIHNFDMADSEREKLGVNARDLAGYIIEVNAIRTFPDFILGQNNCVGLRTEPWHMVHKNHVITKGKKHGTV